LDRMPIEGSASRLVRGLLKRRPRAFPEVEWAGIFEKLRRMVEYYARERGGIGWKWQAMDSKHSPAPLGGQKVGNNPTDRGKLGAKINLLVDERGAPLSVVLTGANRHDRRSPPSA
jgi:putative transposase